MIARRLRSIGISSDVMHVAALASIGASLAIWAKSKAGSDQPGGERSAIFVGLWAPTFFAIADLIAIEEKQGV